MTDITLRPAAPADVPWIVARHGDLYAQDEGYDETFPALVADIMGDFFANQRPDREQGWIASDGTGRLGCIFVVEEEPATAKLRVFLVEPAARGTGLAQTLLDTAMQFARDTGYPAMRLWTHQSHAAAGRIYTRNGFTLVSSAANHAFGCDVIDEIWQRKL